MNEYRVKNVSFPKKYDKLSNNLDFLLLCIHQMNYWWYAEQGCNNMNNTQGWQKGISERAHECRHGSNGERGWLGQLNLT